MKIKDLKDHYDVVGRYSDSMLLLYRKDGFNENEKPIAYILPEDRKINANAEDEIKITSYEDKIKKGL